MADWLSIVEGAFGEGDAKQQRAVAAKQNINWGEDANSIYGDFLPFAEDKGGGNLRFAMPSGLRELGRGVGSLLRGEYMADASGNPTSLTPEGINALLAVAGGAPKPEGAAGIFGGRLSKTANTKKLGEAMTLESRGASREEILDKTGWFRGEDTEWRYEISDLGMKIKPEAPRYKNSLTDEVDPKKVSVPFGSAPDGKPYKLKDILQHDKLFAAYPDLADYHVKHMPLANIFGTRGAYDHDNKRIYLNTLSEEEAASVLAHELQHGVQAREGFEPGANPDMFISDRAKAAFDEPRKRAREVFEKASAEGINRFGLASYFNEIAAGKTPGKFNQEQYDIANRLGLLDELKEAMRVEKAWSKRTELARAQYLDNSGEREARNVQTRLKEIYNADTGLPIAYPWETFDEQAVPKVLAHYRKKK